MDDEPARDQSHSPASGAQTPMHASGSSGALPITAQQQGQYRSHIGAQSLRSRHSSVSLSQYASSASPTSPGALSNPSDLSTRPSQMFGRSKVLSGSSTPVPRRPSTADTKREDVTPWEFDRTVQPAQSIQHQDPRGGAHHHAAQPQPPPRSASSMRSRTSSIPVGPIRTTGPVDEVTPWETHPGPEEEAPLGSAAGTGAFNVGLRPRANTGASGSSTHSGGRSPGSASGTGTGTGIGYGISIEKDFGPDKSRMVASSSAATMSLRSRASSAALAVGPVEDVTPWEVQELTIEEEERDSILASPLRSPALSHPTSQSRGGPTNASARSRASSIAQRGTGTGTVAEVTPWEVQGLLLEESEEDIDIDDLLDVGAGDATTSSQHRKSVDDHASVVSNTSRSSISGPSGRFSRKSERKSAEVERIGAGMGLFEPGGGTKSVVGAKDRRRSFASGHQSAASIRASIEFGIKGGLGYGVPIEKHYETTSPTSIGINGPSGVPPANGHQAGALDLVENVTPWELYPVPPVPPLPSEHLQSFESPEQETITKRPRSRLISSKAMLSTLKGRGSHKDKGVEKDKDKEEKKEKEKEEKKKASKETSRISEWSAGSAWGPSASLQVGSPGSGTVPAAASASTSTLASYSSQPSIGNGNTPYHQSGAISASSQHSLPQSQRSIAMTGTVEDVLPWEMHETIPPVPPLPSLVISDPSSSNSISSISSSDMPTPMPSYGQSQFALAQSRGGAGSSTQVEFQTLRAGVKLELSPSASASVTPRSASRAQTPMLSLPLPAGPTAEVNPWDRDAVHSDVSNEPPTTSDYDSTASHLESPVDMRNHHRLGSGPPSPIDPSANDIVGRKPSLPVLRRSPPAPPPHIPSPTHSNAMSYTPTPTQPFTPISAAPSSIAQSISSGTTATVTSVSSAGTGTGTGKHRASMTAEQLEEVTPWELQPGPKQATIHEVDREVPGSTKGSANVSVIGAGDVPRPTIELHPAHSDPVPHIAHGASAPGAIRQSVSAGVAKSKGALPDLALRRRRSTGASGATGSGSLTRRSGKAASREKERARRAAANGDVSPPSISADPSFEEDGVDGRQFSTPDRTIMEQIKESLRAKDAQFKFKGVGQTVLGGGKGPGKKHHPFPSTEVPYPRSYDRDVVDLDVWETMVTQQLADSLTWHVFETPPTRVLDIGCGTGTWVMQCASKWKECHVVGLDIVPLHPNLQTLGSADLASRVTWMQHNFTSDTLPFQDGEFDFVHIKRIALGMPDAKWDDFLGQIVRVLKPGGAFELIEEDLFFPGTRQVEDEDNALVVVAPHPATTASVDDASQTTPSMRKLNLPGDSESAVTPRVGNVDLPPSGPTRETMASHGPGFGGRAASSSVSSQITTAQPTASGMLHGTNQADSFNDLFSASSAMVVGSMAIATQGDPIEDMLKRQRQQEKEDAAFHHNHGAGKNDTVRKQSAFLLRNMTTAPVNPRDHSLLAAVWQGMLESRNINLTPLPFLLDSHLQYHFKDLRTHAPIFYTFPYVLRKQTAAQESRSRSPRQTPPQSSSTLSDHNSPTESSDDTDSARDAIISRPRASKSSLPSSTSSQSSRSSLETGFPSNESSAIRFPSSTSGAGSYHTREHRPAPKPGSEFSELPNTAMNVDNKTLNLHLMLRAKEVLACSESMWEYVQSCQEGTQPTHEREFAFGILPTDGDESDSAQNLIMDMARDDFDLLLNNFELDMLDKAGVGQALEKQPSWKTFPSAAPLDDRNLFDKACTRYDDWVADQMRKSSQKDGSTSSFSSTTAVNPTPRESVSSSTSHTLTDSASPPNSQFLSPTYTDVPPEKLLSRVLRVYVAWKAPQ